MPGQRRKRFLNALLKGSGACFDDSWVSCMADGQTEQGEGALRRLLRARGQAEVGAGRAPSLPQTAPPTPARAAATALGRAADRLYKMQVQPDEVTAGAATLAEMPELIPEDALLAVLQGPGDAVAMVALCPEAVTALIEMQTLGRITRRPVERRKITRADAMLCADFITACLTELAVDLAPLQGFGCVAGFRYATHLSDLRPLMLMLDDKAYRSLSFQLRLGGPDPRQARIFMAFPQRDMAERPVPVAAPKAAQPARARPSLSAFVQDAPVELVGVLCRRRISLGELRGLIAGKMLALPRVNLANVRLETPDGQLLSTGKFGESEGCHAIRLHDRDAGAVAPAPNSHVDLATPDEFRQTEPQMPRDSTVSGPPSGTGIVVNGQN